MLAFLEEYIGRIVAVVVTPVVSGLSGAFAIWAAENLPGAPELDATALAAIGSAAALAAAGALIQWLHNRGKYEERQDLLTQGGDQG